MKICKSNALRLWDAYYGNVRFAEDFHGNLMCRDGYGNADYCVIRWGRTVYRGWNIHHILPIACGGTNEKQNLICTNIYTNDMAEDCKCQRKSEPGAHEKVSQALMKK